MATTVTGYSPNSASLAQMVNSSDLNGLESLLINYKQLISDSTSTINNIGTDPASLTTLDNEQATLEASRSAMLNRKTELTNQKSNLLTTQISINGQNIALETWIANTPFNVFNYANKISKIEVHYTSIGVMGMRIIYRSPTKAQEVIGIVTNINNSSPTTIENVNFADDEWLMQVQITAPSSNSNTPSVALCDTISFYTSKNNESSPKVTIPASAPNNSIQNKIYYVDNTRLTWLEHKKRAEDQGAELACFENSDETAKMLTELGNARYDNGGSFWIGLYHPNALESGNNAGGGTAYNVTTNINSGWKWVDNTPYYSTTTNWNGGEPNNWASNENVAQMYSNGKFNDLNKNATLAAIYQKKITNTTTQTIKKTGEHIKYFTVRPLSVTYDFIASIDAEQRLNALSTSDNIRQIITEIMGSATIIDDSIMDINEAIKQVTTNIEHIKSKRVMLNELNSQGQVFNTNYNNTSALSNIRQTAAEGFTNLFSGHIINMGGSFVEGFVEGNTTVGSYIAANQTAQSEAARITGNLVSDIQSLKDTQTSNAIGEFVIKKDNIFTNVLTDYMLNDEKQNTMEGVYNKIDQQNIDKMRNIEINTYYDKAYKEYINILKIIIFACVIIVPIVIANKNSLLPSSITNFLIVSVITLTISYIIYKFYDIYMRDNRDFDKISIPYDKEAARLQAAGTLTRKNNFLSQFGISCIGEDCCPDSSGLVYDPVKNKCVVKEVFSEYDGGYLTNTLGGIIDGSIDGLLGGSNQVSNYSIVEPYLTKEQMAGTSLNYSNTTAFNNPSL